MSFSLFQDTKRQRDEDTLDEFAPAVPEPMQTTVDDDHLWNPVEVVSFNIELNEHTIQVEMDYQNFTPASLIKISGDIGSVIAPFDVVLYSVLLMIDETEAERGTFGAPPKRRFVSDFVTDKFSKLKRMILGDKSTVCEDVVSLGIVAIMLTAAASWAGPHFTNSTTRDIITAVFKIENFKSHVEEVFNKPGTSIIQLIIRYWRLKNAQQNTMEIEGFKYTKNIDKEIEAWRYGTSAVWIENLGNKTAALFPYALSKDAQSAARLFDNLTKQAPWEICEQIFTTFNIDSIEKATTYGMYAGPVTATAQFMLNRIGTALFRGSHKLICGPLGLGRNSVRRNAEPKPPAAREAPRQPPRAQARARYVKLHPRDQNGDEMPWHVYDKDAETFLTKPQLYTLLGRTNVVQYPTLDDERIDGYVTSLSNLHNRSI